MVERAAVLVLAMLAFGASLWSPFFFDDYALVTDPAVTRPAGVLELLAPERTRPLTYATFWANYQAGGFSPFGFHLLNLVLFGAVIWLAGDIFTRVEGRSAGWIALAVFALHPLQTEAVAYVFARSTLLATLLCLLSWRAWIRGSYWRAVAWFALALLAKEEAAAFPLFLAGFEWFHRRRRQGWGALRAPLAAMSALVALFGARLLYATRVIEGSGAGLELGEITPWTYCLTQGRAIWLYLRLFLLPAGQTFDRDFRLSAGPDFETAAAWVALAAVFAAALRLSRRWPPAWWFAGALILLAPTSSFAPLADLTAERRMFLPLVSLALLGGSAVAALAGRQARVAGGVLAVALAAGGWARTQAFASEVTLWRDAATKAPAKVRPKLQLARALGALGPSAATERQALLEQARALSPSAEVWGEIGVFHLQNGDPAAAEAAFRQGLTRIPEDAQTLSNLGTAIAYQGRLPEAEQAFRQALAADVCNFDARNNLMHMLIERGAAGEARSLAQVPADCPFSQEQLEALAAARAAP